MTTHDEAKVAARTSRIFYDELRKAGFSRRLAGQIICAWTGRAPPTPPADAAALNAIFANFADRITGRDE